ncbi:serine incorporator/TMS membrane protein [Sporodiniella umbellata]|nr:serine incorporator/TMS membrane protein [Sporodiniella umbellata]
MGALFSIFALPALTSIGTWVVGCCSAAVCSLGCKNWNCENSIATRIGYALIFLLNSMLAWLMLSDFAVKQISKITLDYLKLSCVGGKCYGTIAVHRVCFALFFFHVVFGLLLLKSQGRSTVQNGWWGPKILFWISLVVGSFFVPNEFFEIWGNYLALIGAAVFILYGLVLLVDFAHRWTERCLENMEFDDSNNTWKYILIGSTLFTLISSAVLIGVLYGYFAECSLNQFFITFHLILTLSVALLCIWPQVQEANPRSGLSQSSIVILYGTYLVLSAVANEPDDQGCNPLVRSDGPKTTSILLGTLFTFLAIAYSTSRAAYKDRDGMQHSESRENLLIENGAYTQSSIDQDKDSEPYNYSFFHFVFAMASMYVAMLLTNWNTIISEATDSGTLVRIGNSYIAVWVKIVSGWLCYLLYGWSLLAPVFMPDRFLDD